MSDFGILDKGVHARLLEDIEDISRTANVPVFMIKQSMSKYCTPEEMDWVRNMRSPEQEGVAGLCLEGPQSSPIDSKMMAMAAALLRNFIDARVLPISDLMADDASKAPNPTVLLIPNFHITGGGKPLAGWQIQVLHSILISRFVAGRKTVLYVRDMNAMEDAYGAGIADHIRHHYTFITNK